MTSFSNVLRNLSLRLYCLLRSSAQPQKGQGALEYIAIAVGLIILVFAAFTLLGTDINTIAKNLICDVTGGAYLCR